MTGFEAVGVLEKASHPPSEKSAARGTIPAQTGSGKRKDAICRQARSNSVPSCLPVTRAQFFLFISPLALLRSLYPYSGIRETHCCSVLSQVRSRDRNRDSHTPKRHHPPT